MVARREALPLGGVTMDNQTIEVTMKACLQQIHERLDKAASIAKAAEACSDAGNIEKAIEIVLDVEQPVYEVTALLNAASLINRVEQD